MLTLAYCSKRAVFGSQSKGKPQTEDVYYRPVARSGRRGRSTACAMRKQGPVGYKAREIIHLNTVEMSRYTIPDSLNIGSVLW